MKKIRQKFPGSLEELKKLVVKNSFSGNWRSEILVTGGTKHTFRCKNGGVLVYWQSRGTVLFQGKSKGYEELSYAIGKYLLEEESSQWVESPQKTENEYDE